MSLEDSLLNEYNLYILLFDKHTFLRCDSIQSKLFLNESSFNLLNSIEYCGLVMNKEENSDSIASIMESLFEKLDKERLEELFKHYENDEDNKCICLVIEDKVIMPCLAPSFDISPSYIPSYLDNVKLLLDTTFNKKFVLPIQTDGYMKQLITEYIKNFFNKMKESFIDYDAKFSMSMYDKVNCKDDKLYISKIGIFSYTFFYFIC